MLFNPRSWGALKRKWPHWSGLTGINEYKRQFETVPPNTGVPGSENVYPNTGPPGLMPRASEQIPSPGALARIGHHSQGIGPNYGASGNAAINAAMAKKKKGSMIKDIADALKDLKPGPDAPELAGGKFGRGQPAPLGFSLASMGGRLGEQEAMAKARREEELRRRMKLMGGGY